MFCRWLFSRTANGSRTRDLLDENQVSWTTRRWRQNATFQPSGKEENYQDQGAESVFSGLGYFFFYWYNGIKRMCYAQEKTGQKNRIFFRVF